MSRTFAGVVAGMIAGAAGATALNAVSHIDQAVRGRPASDAPKRTAAALADVAGASDVDVANDDTTANRLEGIGSLAGLGVGVGIGALAGVLRIYWVKVPKPLAPVLVGLAAMAVSDGTMAALGVAEPKKWTPGSVVEDAVPHIAYGMVTTAALHRLLDPRTPRAR